MLNKQTQLSEHNGSRDIINKEEILEPVKIFLWKYHCCICGVKE